MAGKKKGGRLQEEASGAMFPTAAASPASSYDPDPWDFTTEDLKDLDQYIPDETWEPLVDNLQGLDLHEEFMPIKYGERRWVVYRHLHYHLAFYLLPVHRMYQNAILIGRIHCLLFQQLFKLFATNLHAHTCECVQQQNKVNIKFWDNRYLIEYVFPLLQSDS